VAAAAWPAVSGSLRRVPVLPTSNIEKFFAESSDQRERVLESWFSTPARFACIFYEPFDSGCTPHQAMVRQHPPVGGPAARVARPQRLPLDLGEEMREYSSDNSGVLGQISPCPVGETPERYGGSAWESNPPAACSTYSPTVLKTAATTRCTSTSEGPSPLVIIPMVRQGNTVGWKTRGGRPGRGRVPVVCSPARAEIAGGGSVWPP